MVSYAGHAYGRPESRRRLYGNYGSGVRVDPVSYPDTITDAQYALWLRGENDDESQVILDDGYYGHQVTTVGQTKNDTAQAKWDNGSLRFDGSGDYLTVPAHAQWDLTDDFTIEFWIYLDASPTNMGVVNWYASSSKWLAIEFDGAGNTTLQVGGEISASPSSIEAAASDIAGLGWHHVRATRVSDTLTLWVDGVAGGQTASVGDFDSDPMDYSGVTLEVGRGTNSAGTKTDMDAGWLDEVIVFNSIALAGPAILSPPVEAPAGPTAYSFSNYVWTATGGANIVLDDADRPTYDHAWVDDGGTYRVYSRTYGTATAATTPCWVDMASDPVTAGGVDLTAFSDDFDDNSYDLCKWTNLLNGGTVTETGGKLECYAGTNGHYALPYNDSSAAGLPNDIDVSVTVSSTTTSSRFEISLDVSVGGNFLQIFFGYAAAVGTRGIITRIANNGTPFVLEETVSSGGITDRIFRITIISGVATFYLDGVVVRTEAISGYTSTGYVRLDVAKYSASAATVTGVFEDFTIEGI